jgi:ubiquinol-cytochrome c reductase cytochrome b subunit
VLAALGGLAQINPVWLFGPYNPAQVSSGSQPDWYMMFLDGSTRLFPSWEIRLWGHTLPPLFWPTVVLPGILFTLAGAYPFIEAKMTKDTKPHNLLQRPRDVPVRTSLGAMAITFYLVLFLSGGNDLIAKAFDISLNAMTWGGRILLLVLPPLAYLVTYRVCLGLQRHDREVLEHGMETGIIKVLPTGEFIEVHQPLGPTDSHGHGAIPYRGAPVPKRMNQIGASTPLRKVRGFFYPVTEKPEIQAAIDEYERSHNGAHEAIEAPQEPAGLSD